MIKKIIKTKNQIAKSDFIIGIELLEFGGYAKLTK